MEIILVNGFNNSDNQLTFLPIINMASFEPVTAKDFDIDSAIPPKQVDVQFAKTSSLITRASRYIPHEGDWRCIAFGGIMLFSLSTGFAEALWWEYLTLVRYIFMAATPPNAPCIENRHLCFVIPSTSLFQIGLPTPFTYDLRELSDNPLLGSASKEILIHWINVIQQRIANLEAWIAIAKFRSNLLGRNSDWNFPPDAPPHTPYLLRPGWRMGEQFEPRLWTFQGACGIPGGQFGDMSTEEVDRIAEALRLVKQEPHSPRIPEGRNSPHFFPPLNLHGRSLFGPQNREVLARQANNDEVLNFFCEIGDDAQIYPVRTNITNVNTASTSSHGRIPSPMSISSSSSSATAPDSPRYNPPPSPPHVHLSPAVNAEPSSPAYSLDEGSRTNISSTTSSSSEEELSLSIRRRCQTARRSVPFRKRRSGRFSDRENH